MHLLACGLLITQVRKANEYIGFYDGIPLDYLLDLEVALR